MTEPDPSGTYHQVPNREVPEWATRGWIVSDARPSHHDRYSTLMELPAECPRRSRLWTWAAILAAGGMIALALEAAFG